MIATVLPALYLLFVLHYSVNVLFYDEWDLVPIIHAALHSHLTFGALWAQHNENRMFVPNVLLVATAIVHDYNSKAVIVGSGLLFVASYFLILAVFRLYLGRRLGPLHVLTLGIVWFSLEDTQNSLWAFQFAWYLIVLLLAVLLFLLARQWRHRNIVLTLAVLTSVAASFSSLQGLFLWPVGLILLLWDRPRRRRTYLECGGWLLLGVITTTIYFWKYDFNLSSGSPSFTLHQPIEALKFLCALMGNVVPTTNADLGAHELLGLVLCVAAVYVVVASLRVRRLRVRTPLPVVLIVFGVLLDASVALGRLNLGISYALESRYTMANLLILVGIVAFAWAQVPTSGVAATGGVVTFRRVGLVILAGLLVVQVVTATRFGVSNGQSTRTSRLIAAQTLVNLDRIPASEGQQLILTNDFWNYELLQPLVREAREDHVSLFAPGPYRYYRTKGPPVR